MKPFTDDEIKSLRERIESESYCQAVELECEEATHLLDIAEDYARVCKERDEAVAEARRIIAVEASAKQADAMLDAERAAREKAELERDAVRDTTRLVGEAMGWQPNGGGPVALIHWMRDLCSMLKGHAEHSRREQEKAEAACVEMRRLIEHHSSECTWSNLAASDEYKRISADPGAFIIAERDRLRAVLGGASLLEQLAAVEHDRWSGWEKYREKCVEQVRRDGDAESHEDRWRRLRETNYANLSEREKESDRVEARKSLAVVMNAIDEVLG